MSYHDSLLSVGLQYISIKLIDLVIGIDYIFKNLFINITQAQLFIKI